MIRKTTDFLIENGKILKNTRKFAKYAVVGIVWNLLSVIFMWFLIDIKNFSGALGSAIAVITILVGKYYTSILIRLINRGILKYAFASLLIYILSVFFMWLFVDIMHLNTVISAFAVIYGLFFLRFILLQFLGLIKKDI